MERITEPVPEVPVRLEVGGETLAVWTASPAALHALGAGRLLTAGFLRDAADLVDLQTHEDATGTRVIEAELSAEAAAAGLREREHRAEHGCGLRYLLDCRPELLPSPTARPRPDLDALPDLFRELFDRSPTRRGSGGHHSTALSDGGRLVHFQEEVGRHNGVDKVLGAALLAGNDMSGLGLVTSARVSGEIAEKAARAGLAWVASRSVPTTLAVEIARAAGLPIIARAAGPGARAFGVT